VLLFLLGAVFLGGTMRYTFDYSEELNRFVEFLDADLRSERINTLDLSYKHAHLFSQDKLELFCETANRMNDAAKVNGGVIDVIVDETTSTGRIILASADYVILGDDISKQALLFALNHADSLIVNNNAGKVIFDIMLNLK
jgi:hypothetical protein